ncbi:MAG TPA: sulfurtransferase [Alphaproteobacteria bacterium]|nr:sulfurtransferase [Alphaproteobacteria bacterium]
MSETQYRHPGAIVSTEWLAANLDDPAVPVPLRIYDCTTYLALKDGPDRPYTIVSGRADYEAAHIPGSGFLDLQKQLSDKASRFRFTMLPPGELAARFGQMGVGDGVRVVLYSRKSPVWATRVWWMLRAVGFDNAAVLDGGWDKWSAEGRPASAKPSTYPAGTLTVKPRPDLFVGPDSVEAAIGDAGICTINALSPELHRGESPRYGRAGRIPGSVNVPAGSLFDPETKELAAPDAAAAAFAAVGAEPDKRVITYCGGGIAATLDAFLLHQLGYEDITVYDNSMSEWATDERLPIEAG